MRAFSIGYIITLSFLLVLTVSSITLGYFGPPKGPIPPEYPSTSLNMGYNQLSFPTAPIFGQQNQFGAFPATPTSGNSYQDKLRKYEEDKKNYDEEKKVFMQEEMVPYIRNIFVAWIMIFVIFEVTGLMFAKFISTLVGAAYAFSGAWAVIFGPLWGITFTVSSLVASLTRQSENTL